MKSILISVLLLACLVLAAKEPSECECFEEFAPEKEGDDYYCRGKKNFRIFQCGEKQPPRCKCVKDGKEVTLDIGEVLCSGGVDVTYDDLNCQPKEEWEKYLKDHPHRRIYHR